MATSFAALRARYGTGSLVVAAALPFLFVNRFYQPTRAAGSLTIDLSDVAVAIVVVVALFELRAGGRIPGSRGVWLAWGAFLVWIAASTVYGRLLSPSYPLGTHAGTAMKFAGYALLAPATALLVRSLDSFRPVLAVALAWSGFLTLIGALQFLGVVAEFDGLRPGQREPSYLGLHEFGSFSGAILTLALVAIAFGLPRLADRRAALVAGIAGGLGVALAAALDSVGALVLAGAGACFAAARRGTATVRRIGGIVLLVVAVALLAVTLRASAIQAFLRFLGLEHANRETTTHVQSYAHRTLLGYIGVRIWLDHPLLGVGWQGSVDPFAFEPELPAAHKRFPNEPAQAFPSPAHAWGVQNGAVQALADMGPLGLILFLGVVLVPLRAAGAVAARGPPEQAVAAALACGWLLFSLAVITGTGLVTGSSVDAMLWIAVGLAARSTATVHVQ